MSSSREMVLKPLPRPADADQDGASLAPVASSTCSLAAKTDPRPGRQSLAGSLARRGLVPPRAEERAQEAPLHRIVRVAGVEDLAPDPQVVG